MKSVIGHGGETPKWGLIGAVVSAVGASVCCLGPLLLLALGVSGAWIGNLTAMEPYRPYLMGGALVLLGSAFFRVYGRRGKAACAPGSTCPPETGRKTKIVLWLVTAFVLLLLFLPYLVFAAYAGAPEEGTATRQVTLSLRNMTCSACALTVHRSLTRLEGVKDTKVTLDPPRAVVLYNSTRVGPERLIEATTAAGFPATILSEGGVR